MYLYVTVHSNWEACTYNLWYEMALTLLPRHRQCGCAGSAVAVGSSMLQDVAKHCRTVSRSHTPFLHPFVDCARVSWAVGQKPTNTGTLTRQPLAERVADFYSKTHKCDPLIVIGLALSNTDEETT